MIWATLPIIHCHTAGTGCGVVQCCKIEYRTCTCITRFGNTMGLPVPVANPNRVWEKLQRYQKICSLTSMQFSF
jgi:hypothetical protein